MQEENKKPFENVYWVRRCSLKRIILIEKKNDL